MAARLKVFCTTTGLTRSLIAVRSKAKALEAWGARQDLFKQGSAQEVTDPALVEAALARPGEVVIQNAFDAGALEAALAAEPKPARKVAAVGKAAPKKPAGPPKALLEQVTRLEKRLGELDRRQEEALDDLRREREALDAQERELVREHRQRRKSVEADLVEAKAAVEAASA